MVTSESVQAGRLLLVKAQDPGKANWVCVLRKFYCSFRHGLRAIKKHVLSVASHTSKKYICCLSLRVGPCSAGAQRTGYLHRHIDALIVSCQSLV